LVLPKLKYEYNSIGEVLTAYDGVAVKSPTIRSPYEFQFADGFRSASKDPTGNKYTMETRAHGYEKRAIDELGRITTSKFDGRGRVIEHIFPEQNKELFAYDKNDNVIRKTLVPKPCVQPCETNIVVNATYNTLWNKPATITDPKGSITKFTYVASGVGAGELSKVELPSTEAGQSIFTYTYYSNGLTDTITAPNGVKTKSEYDTNGFLIKSTESATGFSHVTEFTNDLLGNVTSVNGPRTDVIDVEYTTYDQLRRKVFEIGPDPDGTGDLKRQIVRHVYDADGNEIRTEIGYGAAVDGSDFVITQFKRMTYDASGKVIKTEAVIP